MPTSKTGTYHCKVCGSEHDSISGVREHYKHNHPEHYGLAAKKRREQAGLAQGRPRGPNYKTRKATAAAHAARGLPDSDSPLDMVLYHRRGLAKAMRHLDAERDSLMARVKEIDDTQALYKTLTAGISAS